MKIKRVETLACDGGWRPWLFVKVTTDDGLVGWSECTDSHGSPSGLRGVIADLEPLLLGRDPRAVEKLYWDLYMATRQSPGGIVQKALGGIENALLDVKAKALGVPVYELFGGPLRDRVRVYWSHCGTTRARAWKLVGREPLLCLDDVVRLGREVRESGFTALKTNIIIPGDPPRVHMPGFGGDPEGAAQNVSRRLLGSLECLVAAFRQGAGEEVDILVDLNFNLKPEGIVQAARALERFDLMWLEADCYDPAALGQVRQASRIPICSGENLYTARGFRPYFEEHAMDVASIDVLWNGFAQAKKIADMAEVYEMNVTPHNYYSHLATFMSAQFCAIVPNLRILEVDVDDVPWKDELLTSVPSIADGHMAVPTRPGWGVELNEEVLRAHPWTR